MHASKALFSLVLAASFAAGGCVIQAKGGLFDAKDESTASNDDVKHHDAKGGGPKDADPNKVTTGLPATAAHASIVWYVDAIDDVPDAALGNTAQTKVDGAKAAGFIAEVAIGNIAPSVLATRHLPKTAKALLAVQPITDAKSLGAAIKVVDGARSVGEAERATIPDASDKSSAGDAFTRTFEALDAMIADLQKTFAGGKAPIRDRALAPWKALLVGANDDTVIASVSRDVPLYVALLKTGVAPKRSTKTTPHYLHPSIRTFFRVVSGWPIEDAAQILGVDATDTLHGKNVEVTTYAADVALRDLAPRILDRCGDADTAAKLRAAKPVKDEASLNATTLILGAATDSTNPKHLCAKSASDATQSPEAAMDAYRWQKQKINDHPYYARSAIAGWDVQLSVLVRADMPYAEARDLAIKELQAYVAKLKTLAPRKETSREAT